MAQVNQGKKKSMQRVKNKGHSHLHDGEKRKKEKSK